MNQYWPQEKTNKQDEEHDFELVAGNEIESNTNVATERPLWFNELTPTINYGHNQGGLYPNVIYVDHDDPRFNFEHRKNCVTVRPFYRKITNQLKTSQK